MSTAPAAVTAANIRAEMARQAVTQAQLGEALGLSQTQVSKRLRGLIAFDINELVTVAGALGVPLSSLTEGVAVASLPVVVASAATG